MPGLLRLRSENAQQTLSKLSRLNAYANLKPQCRASDNIKEAKPLSPIFNAAAASFYVS